REEPTAEVHGNVGGVKELDGVHQRQVCVRQDFGKEDVGKRWGRRIALPGSAAEHAAGTPTLFVSPSVRLRRLIHDDKREAKSVSASIPTVVVFEVEDFLIGTIEQLDAFALIVELAGVLAGDGGTGSITGGERRLVLDHKHALARTQAGNGASRKIELDAVDKVHARQVNRCRGGDVL